MSLSKLCTYMCSFEKDYIYLCLKRFILVCAENSIYSLYFVRGILISISWNIEGSFIFAKSWLCLFSTDLCFMIIFCIFLYWSNLILDWSEKINSFSPTVLILERWVEGADLDDLINLEGTVRGTIFSGSKLGLISGISLNNIFATQCHRP